MNDSKTTPYKDKKRSFNTIFLFGFLLADLSILSNHSNISLMVQLISIVIIYVLFLISSELIKKKYIINIRDGLSIGLLLKVLTLFILESFRIDNLIIILASGIDFLIFRYIAFELIQLTIRNKDSNKKTIKNFNSWMKIESYFIFIFLISTILYIVFGFNLNLKLIFFYMFIPSIIFGTINIFKSRKLFN